jgi:type II restriction enzyme
MSPKYIKIYKDLVTSPAAIKQGFLSQALAKSENSKSYLKRAEEFKNALEEVDTIDQLLKLTDFRNEVLAAAGFSDKAAGHFSEGDLDDSLKTVFQKIFAGGAATVREQLVYRYLLTKGDTLGGSMRNFVGALAATKLTASLIKALRSKGIKPTINKKSTGKITSVSWKNRYLVFDYKLKLIKKNIDVILLNTSKQVIDKIFADPKNYLAFGELKGGIDPAGADEHWKTASGALARIRKGFNKPSLFFVGAAIEVEMAKEIYADLESGNLAFAANLGSEQQLEDLAAWLVNL